MEFTIPAGEEKEITIEETNPNDSSVVVVSKFTIINNTESDKAYAIIVG